MKKIDPNKTKDLAKTVVNVYHGKYKKKVAPSNPKGVIRRIEGNIAWVHILSNEQDQSAVIDETPVDYTIGAKVGDTVRLRIENKKAWIVGDYTSPPTDDYVANRAEVKANTARKKADQANDVAETADKNAAVAQKTADNAIDLAGQAEADANRAKTAADQAQTDANAAKDAADDAKDAADQAQADANTAKTNAQTAITNAANAQAAASQAQTDANAASAAASQAQTDANAASAAASQAQTDANTAKTNAAQAQTAASQAQTTANTASTAAAQAQTAASQAQTDANTAKTNAQTAITNAAQAQAAATQAQTSADNASEYASRALGNLSTVQSVTETLTWITQHGTMALTTDTVLDPRHVYFVIDPTGDYTVGSTKYSIVAEPDVSDISTYYELTIDESLNNYVGTHLSLTSDGLWLLPTTSGGNKVLIATGNGSTYTRAGTYLIDAHGDIVAEFGSNGTYIYKWFNDDEYNFMRINSAGIECGNYTFNERTQEFEEIYTAKLGVDDSFMYARGDAVMDPGGMILFYFPSYIVDSEGFKVVHDRGTKPFDTETGYCVSSYLNDDGLQLGHTGNNSSVQAYTRIKPPAEIGDKIFESVDEYQIPLVEVTYSNAGYIEMVLSGDISAGNITASGDIWADGNIECDGDVNANGDITTLSDISADGTILGGSIEDTAGNVLAEKITAPTSPSANNYLKYNGTAWAAQDLPTASTSNYGVTKLNSSTSSTSTSQAATPSAVKSAYDLADTANTAIGGGGISSSLFVTEAHDLFASTSIAGNSHKYGTVDFTKTGGYYPISIAGWNVPDTVFIPSRLRLSAQGAGTATVAYDVYNPRSSSQSSKFIVYILWLKAS